MQMPIRYAYLYSRKRESGRNGRRYIIGVQSNRECSIIEFPVVKLSEGKRVLDFLPHL